MLFFCILPWTLKESRLQLAEKGILSFHQGIFTPYPFLNSHPGYPQTHAWYDHLFPWNLGYLVCIWKLKRAKNVILIRITLLFSCLPAILFVFVIVCLYLAGEFPHSYFSFLVVVSLWCQDSVTKHRKFTSYFKTWALTLPQKSILNTIKSFPPEEICMYSVTNVIWVASSNNESRKKI